MDTSETYIRMCRTPEIQRSKQDHYDRRALMGCDDGIHTIVHPNPLYFDTYSVAHCDGSPPHLQVDIVWLPRQDQLQEMVKRSEPVDPLLWLLEDFYVFFRSHESTGMTSMEQLWLAFVMKEKYGKTWNGEEWSA